MKNSISKVYSRTGKFSSVLLAMVVLSVPMSSYAEPYLAVRSGLKCMACHVNPTGGGKRTELGNAYAQNTLAAKKLLKDGEGWLGRVNDYLAVGGNSRVNANFESVPNQRNTAEFELEESLLYIEANIIPGRVTLYLDERIAPGSALNRESYALLWTESKNAYLKAGRFFLASGYRIEDDGAFIREVTGVNFNNSDTGVEAGLELDAWSASLSVSNGTNGGSETNNKKQYALRTEYIQPAWRMGFGVNYNQGNSGSDRTIVSLFTGFKLWGIDWLGEVDYIDDQTGVNDLQQEIFYLEANLEFKKGHNFKLGLEYYDPNTDIDENQRTRTSLVWEYNPFEYTQVRTGVRLFDGIPQNNSFNRDEFFVQLHNYF